MDGKMDELSKGMTQTGSTATTDKIQEKYGNSLKMCFLVLEHLCRIVSIDMTYNSLNNIVPNGCKQKKIS